MAIEPNGAERRIRFSLPTKIFLGFFVVLALFASVLIYNFDRLNRLYEEVTLINRGLVPLRLTLSEMQGDLRSYAVLLAERDPVVLRDALGATHMLSPFPRRIRDRLSTCLSSIEQLEAQELTNRQGELFAMLRRTVEDLGRRNQGLATQSDRLMRVIETDDTRELDLVRRELADSLVQMQAETALLNRQTGAIVSNALDWAASQQRRNILTVAISAAVAMGIALLIMLWSARTLRPLTQLTVGVKSLRGGAYQTVDVESRNELGVLAAEFNQMVGALKERDVALERAHQTAIESERLATIGRMTSQITHEIRNPLSSIALNIELLQEELQTEHPSSSEAVSTARNITREIDQLTDITEEYLQFARLPAPNKSLEDLNEMIRQLLQFHSHELTQAGVDVVLELDEDLPTVEVDEGQLRQAVLNLVRNAREAMTGGGELRVGTRLCDDNVLVTIHDEGVGIPPDVRERVFDPFFTTKSQGTGLGLPSTRQIITQHGGEIRVWSTKGEGTTFTVSLPSGKTQG